MRVFALADLHLSSARPKPMTVFGPLWAEHPQAIFREWPQVVGEDDVVLLPGDISWAMKLDGAMADLRDLAALPGRKVLLRGNHDYWWPSIGKLRAALPPGMLALQNDALYLEGGAGLIVSGVRGWLTPGSEGLSAEDRHIYEREGERLRLSLEAAARLRAQHPGARHILLLHYPPTGPERAPTLFTDQIERARPDLVVYGHLHGVPVARSLTSWDGVPTQLVAADVLGFRPALVMEV